MSALSFARQAFGREKPHSSITDWVDILTASGVAEEAYDGIPELVDSINLQASGPAEASRALRKKIKHGNPHQQYRALVILKALVENCGQKFQSEIRNCTFADGHMTDALKLLANDPSADKRVKRKLTLVLGSWRDQYKVIHPCRPLLDKPKVLASIVEASQASSNLVNAITLVNRATDSLSTNERVQECLAKAKQARKPVVRYIQLVENEEVIGTLIETNDRINAALEMFEELSVAGIDDEDRTKAVTESMAAATITHPESGIQRNSMSENAVKGKNRDIKQPAHVYPDLEDLNFGPLGHTSANLPPPLRPSTMSDDEQETPNRRGSLSDFSDYESSDEETHKGRVGSSSKKNYVTVSDNEYESTIPFTSGSTKAKQPVEDDPFADPFADT
ncbi:hypothetical protein CPB84DRAFT_1820537 [Gymnopilus junonius]|uniref:VHS domain-containing protein n=1 Tax=Gymnopilus junonius TaxID=109634 RepID=A0A9P5NXY0_GYMJU|nr:hypothetical protein CPB84DRAFT_1820537 [Gymnopilus junonius]